MIENCHNFTYHGALFTHEHELHVFEEGLLLFPLQERLDADIWRHAGNRPVLNQAYEGWHPASRERGATTRWSFVNADWQSQFRGQADGRRSLSAMAKSFIGGRFDAKPQLQGARAPVPVDLVLCFPIGDTWQLLHFHGGLFTPALRGSALEAIDNLRDESLAPVRDTRLFVPPADDRYLGQVLHGKQLTHVFSSGIYLQDAARAEETGWYPLRTNGANLTRKGAQQLESAPHVLDPAFQGFPVLRGQFNAAPGDPQSRYAWFGIDEHGEGHSFILFDHPLLATDCQGFDARQGEAHARALRDSGHHAALFDPMVIDHIDQLGRGANWGVCGFVAAIQAAWYQGGRRDLLRSTSHATLVPVIQAFMERQGGYEAELLQVDDVQLSFAELKALMARDTAMRSRAVDIAVGRVEQEQLMVQLGLRPDWVTAGAPQPLTANNLPQHSATYCLSDSRGGAAGGHQVYVNPDGQHLLWGKACSPAETLALASQVFDGICDVVRFE